MASKVKNMKPVQNKTRSTGKTKNFFFNYAETLIPVAILLFFIILFVGISKGDSFKTDNLQHILSNTIPYIIAALGCVFVTTMGGTDITQGSLVAFTFAVVCKCATSMSGGSLVIGLLCGIGSGLILGFCNAKLKVPSFMLSLGLLVLFRAAAVMVGGTGYLDVPSVINVFGEYYVSIPLTVGLLIVIWFVFHKTPYGNYVRAIGENENAVKFTGVNVDLIKIIAFALSGLFTALACFTYYGAGNVKQDLASTAGLGFEMSVLIAMFVGGIPVSGGYGSRIHMIVLGAFTISIMENGFITVVGLNTYWVQLIKGAILIAILFLSEFLKRKAAKRKIEAN